MSKPERAAPLPVVPVKNYLDAKQRRERFPAVFSSAAKECRMRAKGAVNLRGEALRWYPCAGGFLVEEAEVIAWIEGNAITSTAQLPADFHGKRHQHLEGARAKAQSARKQAK